MIPSCPKCSSEYAYESGQLFICPECEHEWNEEIRQEKTEAAKPTWTDANGTELANGDTVVLIKSLPVKGAPKPLKKGTKVKNIRLVEGDHNIDCKIDGYGAMALKSEFVKKV